MGSLIDYYNVQFYNQGGDYVTKKTLIVESGKTPNTAVLQLHNVCKIPWAKIVVGKVSDDYRPYRQIAKRKKVLLESASFELSCILPLSFTYSLYTNTMRITAMAM